jgi:hypothetical protein
MGLGSARRKRQNRIQAVQGLDGSFFVYAKDGGMIRRVQNSDPQNADTKMDTKECATNLIG